MNIFKTWTQNQILNSSPFTFFKAEKSNLDSVAKTKSNNERLNKHLKIQSNYKKAKNKRRKSYWYNQIAKARKYIICNPAWKEYNKEMLGISKKRKIYLPKNNFLYQNAACNYVSKEE
jgi:hypothetical protein